MFRYHIAHVRFDGSDQTYPVNSPDYGVGARVIVRMDWAKPRFSAATITEIGVSKSQCTHSVISLEEHWDSNRLDTTSVSDRASLEAFFATNGWTNIPAIYSDFHQRRSNDLKTWESAYVFGYDPTLDSNKSFLTFSSKVILVGGDDDFGFIRLDREGRIFLPQDGGAIVLDHKMIWQIEHGPDQIHRKVAETARDGLFWIVEGPDTTTKDIREAINGAAGGSAYLSDGVWL